MIIIEGPDASGKTTLARKFGLKYYHFDYNSKYEDYLKPLSSLEMTNAILDRHMISEYAYQQVMKRPFAFNMKQWHNIILLTLIQNPLIILCTHKLPERNYPKDQYMPYTQWDRCLTLYRYFLNTHQIPYTEYDYMGPITVEALRILHEKHIGKMEWWRRMWKNGVGCIGSVYPKVLLVGERQGPNNMNNLPFETGPTGRMLSDMLSITGTPLGKFAVTNMVKSFRRDTRSPNDDDIQLLRLELEMLKPQKVVFMGSIAKLGMKVTRELGIEHHEITHFGYFSHRGITDVSKIPKYIDEWRRIMGISA